MDELSRTQKVVKANSASHIFLIGMERCGANSILEFLGTSIPIKFDSRGRMASRMVFNFFGAHKILEGLEEEIPSLCAYGNLMANFIAGEEKLSGTKQRHIPLNMFRLFKELYCQYPEAKFIFNTRNVDQWIQGRRKIGDGYIMDYYRRCSTPELVGTNEWKEKTIEEVNEDWRKSFTNHREEVLDFFKEKDCGVLMTDIVTYIPPFGILGDIANVVLIKKQLKGIIDYRDCLNEMLSLIKTSPEGHEIWYLEHPSVFTQSLIHIS